MGAPIDQWLALAYGRDQSAKQTPAKEAKNKELLVARYAFAPYKLTKLQIAGIEVTSLA
jgi:hypothetical protein